MEQIETDQVVHNWRDNHNKKRRYNADIHRYDDCENHYADVAEEIFF